MTEATVAQQRRILALVTDLFFTLKIGDTAKSVGLPIHFVGSAEEFLDSIRKARPGLVIADLTLDGIDLAALFEELAAEAHQVPVPILGYTTHADWKRTEPLARQMHQGGHQGYSVAQFSRADAAVDSTGISASVIRRADVRGRPVAAGSARRHRDWHRDQP